MVFITAVLVGLGLQTSNATPLGSCEGNDLVQEVALPGQPSGVPKNLLKIEVAQRLVCEAAPIDVKKTVGDARQLLRSQRARLQSALDAGKIKPIEFNHYSGLFRRLEDNLQQCSAWAKQLRAGSSVPLYNWKMHGAIRSGGLIDIDMYDDNMNSKFRIVSHEVWLGTILDDLYYDICNIFIRRAPGAAGHDATAASASRAYP